MTAAFKYFKGPYMEERKHSELPVHRSDMEVARFYTGAFYRAGGEQVEVCSLECHSTGLQPCEESCMESNAWWVVD